MITLVRFLVLSGGMTLGSLFVVLIGGATFEDSARALSIMHLTILLLVFLQRFGWKD